MQEDDLVNLLKSFKVFTSLDQKTFKKLLPRFEKITLTLDQFLFRQNDASDALYFLLTGKLAALLTTNNGKTKRFGVISAGETVGELGAISGEPRTLSIKAMKESILYKLSAKDFREVCYRYPGVLFEMMHPIIARSQQAIGLFAGEKVNKQIVIVPLNEHVSTDRFYASLTKHAKKLSSVILVKEEDEIFKDLSNIALEQKLQMIADASRHNQKIVYCLKSSKSQLAKLAFKKADRVYGVAFDQTHVMMDDSVVNFFKTFRHQTKRDPDLILLHSESHIHSSISDWLSLTSFGLHHHVRLKSKGDYQRLLRFIREKAVGVVLGGGGTRGFAHLGALKALLEAKVPIDVIGGTSVGAIVAACYAMTQSYEETEKLFFELVNESRGSVSWRSLTWPVISIFDAKKFTAAQKKIFKRMKIEQFAMPYFCVSSNMATKTENIHQSGLVWEKLRASASIPGLIPPMVINGELHYDGGLLNNLPVDVMRPLVGAKGKVIAIELSEYMKDITHYHFPPVLTFWEAFLSKWGRDRKYHYPHFMDTFLSALFMESHYKSKQNGLIANMLISLELSKFSMLHSNSHHDRELIAVGYETTKKKLTSLNSLNGSSL